MNICIISLRYPYKEHMNYVFVKKLVDEWAKMGHKCVVMTPYSLTSYYRKIFPYKPKHYTDSTVSNNPVEVYNPRFFSIPKITVAGAEVNSRVMSVLLSKELKKIKFKPDVVYCHFFSAAVTGWYISKTLGVPLFVATGESTIDRVYPPCREFALPRFRKDIRGCVCVSSKNKEEAISMGLVDDEKCKVFPNGTDLSVFCKKDKAKCRKKLGLDQNDFIVSCVGGFIDRKGQNRIIEAIRHINNPNIKLMFVGSGNLQLEHESIVFKGRVNNVDLPNYLNASDVFCLPTLAEGCCNAIIEAIACGLPIVSSDLPFNYDVLDSTNAILIDPNDIDAIAAAIQRLYDEPELREQFSAVSLHRSHELSIEQRAKNIMSFIESRI